MEACRNPSPISESSTYGCQLILVRGWPSWCDDCLASPPALSAKDTATKSRSCHTCTPVQFANIPLAEYLTLQLVGDLRPKSDCISWQRLSQQSPREKDTRRDCCRFRSNKMDHFTPSSCPFRVGAIRYQKRTIPRRDVLRPLSSAGKHLHENRNSYILIFAR